MYVTGGQRHNRDWEEYLSCIRRLLMGKGTMPMPPTSKKMADFFSSFFPNKRGGIFSLSLAKKPLYLTPSPYPRSSILLCLSVLSP